MFEFLFYVLNVNTVVTFIENKMFERKRGKVFGRFHEVIAEDNGRLEPVLNALFLFNLYKVNKNDPKA